MIIYFYSSIYENEKINPKHTVYFRSMHTGFLGVQLTCITIITITRLDIQKRAYDIV